MFAFLLRRILGAFGILFAISIITFFLFNAVPGDGVADLACGKFCTQDMLDVVKQNMGLDKPLWQQYLTYMTGIFTGRTINDKLCTAPCLGYSWHSKAFVFPTIMERMPVTISLAIGATVMFLLIGISLGMAAALRKGKLTDKLAMGGALVGGSMQIYVMAPFLLAIFVNTEFMSRPDYHPFLENPFKWAAGLFLPWLCLAIIYMAGYARFTRASMVDVLTEDFVRTARAKGLSRRQVYYKHAFRGAMSPIATILTLDIAFLLGGAIITEAAFSLRGIGSLVIASIDDSDLPLTMAVVLMGAVFVVIANIITDVLYAVIDPRVRLS